ncbi:hypothetical protein CIPAW_11G198200 [Carya illinoinensis]|uniref:TIR domain-containing protein n=1 Tax=Carya illinoinensis TaxID=32201 RepID=A0A8T1PAA1_CARIL|nr:hypothetical protein CIPAW_11G198200 [Carya illinoinensis]
MTVFLSFRGANKNFTDHLYSALMRVGIHTFRDDGELPRGGNISTELQKAIHGSKISIVVFSKGYADSKWCLNELVEITHRAKIGVQTLFPIFYHVDTSNIRKQTGTFADAFARHEEQFQNDMERVKGWRAALRDASSHSGWDIKEVANGYYASFSCFFLHFLSFICFKFLSKFYKIERTKIGLTEQVAFG